jgi:hypothetical protein
VDVETLYAEYVALRISGMRPSAALESLRDRIEVLLPNEKLALVRAVRHYEDTAVETVTSSFRPTGSVAPSLFDDDSAGLSADDLARLAAESGDTTIKLPEGLRKKVAAAPSAAPPFVEPPAAESKPGAEENAHYTSCPNCGNPVLVSLLQCPTCYYVMPSAGPPVETPESYTQALTEPAAAPAIQFGPRTTLVMAARDGRRLFSRPQDSRRETIVGRTDGKTFTADLDLSPLGAATLGVSRVHAALAFDADRNVMTLMDMNSMNGTFLNGLRLQPQDVHDLHPGDQIRFGRLAVRISFENR